MSTSDFSCVICILCLYLHFRASIIFRVEPSDYISNYGHLVEMMYLALVGTMLQMFAQLVEFGVGAHPAFGIFQTICVVLVNVGVGGLVIAASIP